MLADPFERHGGPKGFVWLILFLGSSLGFRTYPDLLKDPKKWDPLIIPEFPQCSHGFIKGGVPCVGSLRGSG